MQQKGRAVERQGGGLPGFGRGRRGQGNADPYADAYKADDSALFPHKLTVHFLAPSTSFIQVKDPRQKPRV